MSIPFTFSPYSRFGNSFLWTVHIDNQCVAKVSLEKNGKVWVNILKHGASIVTPEIEQAIQTEADAIAKMNRVCEICHLPSETPSCSACNGKHRQNYLTLIKKAASGQKVYVEPTLGFYHQTEQQFKDHVKIYNETGQLPNLKKWH